MNEKCFDNQTNVFELHLVGNWKSLKISEHENDIISILKIFICQLVHKMNWSRDNEKKSAISKWIQNLHRHKIMRPSTRMIDEKEKDDHKYCCSYCERLSTQGGTGGKAWKLVYAISVTGVRMDENDEQCQSQQRNQDECGLNKDQWIWGFRKSIAASIMVTDVRLWLKEVVYLKNERTKSSKVVVVKPVSPSLRAYYVLGDVLSTSVHYFI